MKFLNVKGYKIFPFAILAILTIGFGCATSGDRYAPEIGQVSGIKTIFIPQAKLSLTEVEQVVALAKECGIQDVAEIETGYGLPTFIRSIIVRGKERVEGRDISMDTIDLERVGWCDRKPGAQAKRCGAFWTEQLKKYTKLMHEYEFAGSVCRITINQGVDPSLADKVIPQVLAMKVRFRNEHYRLRVEMIMKSQKPLKISKNHFRPGEYDLWFGDHSGSVISFEVNDGEVIVTRIGSWCT